MTGDPVRNYGEALAAFLIAATRVESLIRRLPAGALSDWLRVRFANTGVQFPTGAADRSIDANTWQHEARLPARDLDQALADWHSQLFQMHVAWGRLSTAQQSGLQLPPAPRD